MVWIACESYATRKLESAAAAGIVVFQRQRLQVGVELRAQLEQRLEADLYEQEAGHQPDDAGEKLDEDEARAKGEDDPGGRGRAEAVRFEELPAVRRRKKDIVKDEPDRHGFEKAQPDGEKGEEGGQHGFPEEWFKVNQGAPVDRHR